MPDDWTAEMREAWEFGLCVEGCGLRSAYPSPAELRQSLRDCLIRAKARGLDWRAVYDQIYLRYLPEAPVEDVAPL